LEADLEEASQRQDLVAAARISGAIADRVEESSKAIAADRKLQTNEQITWFCQVSGQAGHSP
jgi:hypothetical protein